VQQLISLTKGHLKWEMDCRPEIEWARNTYQFFLRHRFEITASAI
jgi:hypothetical protein